MKETNPQDVTTQELVRRAQAGDETAFERLVRDHYRTVHRWALARTGDADDADDVVQEVLLRLHRGLGRFDGRARFTTWLYQVTRNAAAEMLRRRGRRARLSAKLAREDAPHSDPEDAADRADAEVAEAVRTFFVELSDRQREVFDLVDLQGFSPAEVGRMLELEAVTVRSHLFRARAAIRKRILEVHPELMEGYGP